MGIGFCLMESIQRLVDKNCERRRESEIAREKKLNKLAFYYYQNYNFL